MIFMYVNNCKVLSTIPILLSPVMDFMILIKKKNKKVIWKKIRKNQLISEQ